MNKSDLEDEAAKMIRGLIQSIRGHGTQLIFDEVFSYYPSVKPWYISDPKQFKYHYARYKRKRLEALLRNEECTAIEPIFNPKLAPKQSYQALNRGMSKKRRRNL